jgi:hypothetical protein
VSARLTDDHEATCPYCWETIVLELDLSAGDQDYSEDCPVCCQPLAVRLRVPADGEHVVEIEREND